MASPGVKAGKPTAPKTIKTTIKSTEKNFIFNLSEKHTQVHHQRANNVESIELTEWKERYRVGDGNEGLYPILVKNNYIKISLGISEQVTVN